MNRISLICLGGVLLVIGINGLITGEATGIAAGYTSPRDISLENSPIEYWLMLSFEFSVGIILIKRNIFTKSSKRSE